MPELDNPLETGANTQERFVREMKEIDQAHHAGQLRKWVEKKLADERKAAGLDSEAGDD